MTTAQSSPVILRAQADRMAEVLKAAERREVIRRLPYIQRLVDARDKPTVTFAVAMDDKILKIEMAWETIRDTTKEGLAEFILGKMREDRHAGH